MAKCKNAWGDQELVAAMEKVKSKELSLHRLLSHLESQKALCQTMLQEEVQRGMEEHRLFFQTLAEMGFPLNKDYVDVVVKGYLKQIGRPNPFGENKLED